MENLEKIKEELNTLFLGKELIYLKETTSTQDYIKTKLKENLPNGLLVLTESQTNGKGTNGRIWYTKPNENLTFSFLLKPNCNIGKFNNLTKVISEVMISTIYELYGLTLEIKYPNDIVRNGKKLAGILTESVTKGEMAKSIIIRNRIKCKSN